VNRELSQEERTIQAQLEEARAHASDLESQLHNADRELTALADQQARYGLLDQVCGSLEQLHSLGAAKLFWGDLGEGRHAEHVGRLRERIDQFQQTVDEIEGRRRTLAGMLAEQQVQIDDLDYDLYQAFEQEERRRQEWIVEREISAVPHRPARMPWIRGGEDDERFRRALAASLVLSLLLGIVLPFIDLPIPKRGEVIEVPERFARLIREEERPPPPPPAPRQEPEPEPEPQRPEPEMPEPPPVEQPPPPPRETPTPAVAETPTPRQRTETTGILAFRESFSSLADSRPSARLGADARVSRAGEAAARAERSMVTTQAPGSSGGINLSSLSRDVGGEAGGQIGGVELTRAASSIGTEGLRERPLSHGVSPSRTDEEIQIVFDRYKAALYRLYNRELRRDPTLRGQMVLRITIEPDGSVSLCALQTTDMNAPELVTQVLERVGSFNFGEKDVPAVTILYPIDFLPAT
jgi:hypothetical protein